MTKQVIISGSKHMDEACDYLPPGEQSILHHSGLRSCERRLVSVSEVDSQRSLRNQARLEQAIIPEHVEDMALAVLDGATLPDLILCDDGGKLLVIWSGNHRFGAYCEAGVNEFPAVIVKCNDAALLDLMPRMFNRTGSMKLNKSEALRHAIYAMKAYDWTGPQAAKAFGVSESAIQRHGRCSKVREELELAHINTSNLKDSHVISLSPLVGNHHVLEKVAQIAVEAKLNSQQLADVAREVRSERSEAKQLDRASALYDELVGVAPSHGRNGKPGQRSASSVFRMQVSGLLKTLEKVSSVKQLDITDRGEIQAANGKLQSLAAECIRVAAGKARRRKGH